MRVGGNVENVVVEIGDAEHCHNHDEDDAEKGQIDRHQRPLDHFANIGGPGSKVVQLTPAHDMHKHRAESDTSSDTRRVRTNAPKEDEDRVSDKECNDRNVLDDDGRRIGERAEIVDLQASHEQENAPHCTRHMETHTHTCTRG